MAPSQEGYAALLDDFKLMFPKMVTSQQDPHFALTDEKVAWVVTYAHLSFNNESAHTVTVRCYDRQDRGLLILRGSETFDTLEDARLFADEIVNPTTHAEHPTDSPEHAEEFVRIVARIAVEADISREDISADNRALATLRL